MNFFLHLYLIKHKNTIHALKYEIHVLKYLVTTFYKVKQIIVQKASFFSKNEGP